MATPVTAWRRGPVWHLNPGGKALRNTRKHGSMRHPTPSPEGKSKALNLHSACMSRGAMVKSLPFDDHEEGFGHTKFPVRASDIWRDV